MLAWFGVKRWLGVPGHNMLVGVLVLNASLVFPGINHSVNGPFNRSTNHCINKPGLYTGN